MENSVILQNIDKEGLKEVIREVVRNELDTLPERLDEKFLSRQEAADKLRVSLPSLDKMIGKGKLPAYRIGGRILLKTSELKLDKIPVSRHR